MADKVRVKALKPMAYLTRRLQAGDFTEMSQRDARIYAAIKKVEVVEAGRTVPVPEPPEGVVQEAVRRGPGRPRKVRPESGADPQSDGGKVPHGGGAPKRDIEDIREAAAPVPASARQASAPEPAAGTPVPPQPEPQPATQGPALVPGAPQSPTAVGAMAVPMFRDPKVVPAPGANPAPQPQPQAGPEAQAPAATPAPQAPVPPAVPPKSGG